MIYECETVIRRYHRRRHRHLRLPGIARLLQLYSFLDTFPDGGNPHGGSRAF